MKLILRIALTLALLTLASTAVAQGDVENGRLLTYTCTGCHGIPGYRNVYPHYHVPKIGGQEYEYLITALSAYRDGSRPHPTMRAQAEGYSEAEIVDIAAYLSSLNRSEEP